MIELDLTPEETAVLASILETDLSDLRMEISHTDSFDFRTELKSRKALLNKVLERLKTAA